MRATVNAGRLVIDKRLYDFVNNEAIPDSGIPALEFWKGFEGLVASLAPRNAALLARRDELQAKIDAWHRQNPGSKFDPAEYKAFLRDIGYLVPEKEPFAVSTANVDPEIAHIAGPQLVVPVSNARYALNAANARWGSLYDALYGTDVIPETDAPRGGKYNPQRGAKVIEFVRTFLDQCFPLAGASHRDAVSYFCDAGGLAVKLQNASTTHLKDSKGFSGYQGDRNSPSALLLLHNGLHVEIQIDRSHYIGRDDAAGVSDVLRRS